MITATHAPIHFLATPAAARAFGLALPDVAREAFLEIGRVARGYAIHHHYRVAGGALVMVALRVQASGIVEIEIDCGHPGLPACTFTCKEAVGWHDAGEKPASGASGRLTLRWRRATDDIRARLSGCRKKGCSDTLPLHQGGDRLPSMLHRSSAGAMKCVRLVVGTE